MHSAATGAVLALLQLPEAERESGLSSFVLDMVIAAISRTPGTSAPEDARRPQSAAAELRTALDAISVLSGGERHLLGELLDRIAAAEFQPLPIRYGDLSRTECAFPFRSGSVQRLNLPSVVGTRVVNRVPIYTSASVLASSVEAAPSSVPRPATLRGRRALPS